jgi:hypothetical protein
VGFRRQLNIASGPPTHGSSTVTLAAMSPKRLVACLALAGFLALCLPGLASSRATNLGDATATLCDGRGAAPTGQCSLPRALASDLRLRNMRALAVHAVPLGSMVKMQSNRARLGIEKGALRGAFLFRWPAGDGDEEATIRPQHGLALENPGDAADLSIP